jgi:hypothetical protein
MHIDLSHQAANAKQRLAALGIRVGAPPKLPPPINPALAKHAEERAANTQNRIADAITRFAGSMAFVYIHIAWFASWIGFGVERSGGGSSEPGAAGHLQPDPPPDQGGAFLRDRRGGRPAR